MMEGLTAYGSRLTREFARDGLLGQLFPFSRAQSDAPRILEPKPVRVQYTPDSILQDTRGYQSWHCNGRERYGTCSGVAWFHGNCIATTNLLGNMIHTYSLSAPAEASLDETQAALVPLQTLRNAPTVLKPENIAFSPNGRLAAITDMGPGDIKLFRVDLETHLLSEAPIGVVSEGDRTAHGIAFSHCGQFFAFTTIDKPGVVRLYRIYDGGNSSSVRVEPFQVFENTLHPLVPKGIDFSLEDDFIALCYAPNTARKSFRDRRGRLATHAFSSRKGIHPKPLSVSRRRHDLSFPEDVSLLGGDRYALLTQQADDTARLIEVDPATGSIRDYVETLRNPDAQLSFPHGVGVSSDGRYAAMTSYGDDKFGIYEIRSEA